MYLNDQMTFFTPLIISLNKAPAVTPINLITPEIAQKLALDMEICRFNMEKLIQSDISEKLRQIYQSQTAQSTKSAESALYSGFIPKEDIKTLESVRSASMEDFSNNSYIFNDNRMNELLFCIVDEIIQNLFRKMKEKYGQRFVVID